MVCVRTHVRVCSVCVVRMHVRVCVHVCMAVGHGACGAWGVGKRQVGMARVGKRQAASGHGSMGGGLVFLCIATCIARLPAFSAQQQTANEEVREGGAQGPAEKFAWV